MGIPLAAKRAFKLSTVAFIFSALLLEIIPHPFKCSNATPKFFAEQAVFFVGSFAVFFCWELTHNLHRVSRLIIDSCFSFCLIVVKCCNTVLSYTCL